MNKIPYEKELDVMDYVFYLFSICSLLACLTLDLLDNFD